MSELFRIKIASKRQMTAPQRLLNLLRLGEGDEIQLEVENGQIVNIEACKVVPTRLFSPDVLSQLAAREMEMAGGRVSSVDPRAAVAKAITNGPKADWATMSEEERLLRGIFGQPQPQTAAAPAARRSYPEAASFELESDVETSGSETA